MRGEQDTVGILARAPELLEPGLQVLEVGVELTAGVVVDLLAKDVQSRPVLVLVAGAGQAEDLLGRALLTLAEVARAQGLLERIYRREGVTFRDGVRAHLVAPRFSDRFHAAVRALGSAALAVTEWSGIWVPPGTRHPSAPAAPATHAIPENGREVEQPAAPPPAPALPPDPGAAEAPGGASVLDETKRKILRVSDEVEEEVDGDLVRFLVRNRVLAVLSGGAQDFSVYVGDQLDRRRRIRSTDDLNQALDDIYRRYFFLLRAAPGAKS